MKIKKLLLLPLFSFVLAPAICSAANLVYTPMEKIPGFPTTGDFPSYIMAVYKFGLWTVGLAALLMISIGGFMYITSAGNNSQTQKAKGVITDAIIGIIMALTSFILLQTINPELVQLKTISGIQNGTGGGSSGGGGGGGGGGGAGTGQCAPLTTGPCSVDSLKGSCFDGKADLSKISSICNAESGGVDGVMSKTDRCGHNANGTAFSCGALQVNLTCLTTNHPECKNAFLGPQNGCANFNCTGAGSGYQACVQQNCNGTGNITAACQLYNEHPGNKYYTWSANSKCGF